jgi:3-mercaptopyruvate sulfurtransferase SseA
MSAVTIPIEFELTPRSRAIMDAIHKAISPQFKADDQPAAHPVDLQPGEHYAGVVLDEAGHVKHHLVLMAPRAEELTWQAATDWAKEQGGFLPTRQEQALLYANCKPHLKPVWHWSCETHKDDASFAWVCYFGDGYQGNDRKSYEGSAVAVRRV